MQSIVLSAEDRQSYDSLFSKASEWCRDHQWELGLVEMAIGASCIHWAVNAGVLTIGKEIVATALGHGPRAIAIGGGLGGLTIGAVAGKIIGSIGVAAMGGAVGIPALVVMAGGSLIVGAVGYAGADLLDRYINAIDYGIL